MSHHFSNFLPSPVILNHGGNLMQLPAGWSGEVNLEGTIEVGTASALTVSTNSIPGTNTTGFVDVTFTVDTAGHTVETSPVGGPLAWGTTINWTVTGPGGVVGSSAFDVVADPTVLAEVYHFNVVGSSVEVYGVPVFMPGTTNYSTNLQAGNVIGTYTASTGLRAVEVDTGGLRTFDYSAEATAATAGFLLAITIAVFRFGLRLVRGFADNGGDL